MAEQEKINRAQEHQPKDRVKAPVSSSNRGGDSGGSALGRAVDELKCQHPIKYDSLGPHHGKDHHDRHEPLHGLHPKSRHGR